MDIEDLSKVQIVLLTLLVSFVTSIATGIVTVSLMDQAPPSIAQTVNRVIERTVQTVVPSTQTGAAVVTQEKTVIVNDSELIAQAVQKASPSVIRIYTLSGEEKSFAGLGVIVNASGTVAVDADSLGQSAAALVKLSDGTYVNASVSSRDLSTGIAFLATATSTTEGKVATWSPVSIATDHITLGQSTVALSGNSVARIASGVVEAIEPATEGTPQLFDTGIPTSSIMAGSPLIDTSGNLIGLSTVVSRAASPSAFVPASALMKSTTASESN